MFIIYGKDNCPWCDRAKLLVGNYVYKDVLSSKEMFEEFQKEFPGAKTVPKIIEVDSWGVVVRKYDSYEALRNS